MDTRRNCNLYLVFLSRLLSVKKEKNSPKSKYYENNQRNRKDTKTKTGRWTFEFNRLARGNVDRQGVSLTVLCR